MLVCAPLAVSTRTCTQTSSRSDQRRWADRSPAWAAGPTLAHPARSASGGGKAQPHTAGVTAAGHGGLPHTRGCLAIPGARTCPRAGSDDVLPRNGSEEQRPTLPGLRGASHQPRHPRGRTALLRPSPAAQMPLKSCSVLLRSLTAPPGRRPQASAVQVTGAAGNRQGPHWTGSTQRAAGTLPPRSPEGNLLCRK